MTSYEELTERLAESFPVRLMILPPLMHGAAQWACFMLMAQGATLIFPDDTHRVDPDDVWTVVEREKANSMTIVGDAVLRPLLMQLDKKSYDLSSFFAVGNGGAPLTPAVRAMAVERIPNLVISDSAGSSETGAQMHVTSMDDVAVGSFLPGPGTLVVDETLSRVLAAGARGQRLAGADRECAAGVSRRPGEDGAYLPRDRRCPLLHPRRPGPAPGRWADRAAGA